MRGLFRHLHERYRKIFLPHQLVPASVFPAALKPKEANCILHLIYVLYYRHIAKVGNS